ncbi:unnamed protein product [Calypogeia fissa]
MEEFGQSGSSRARQFIAVLVCMFMVVSAVASSSAGALLENAAEETVSESFAEVVPADAWVLNESLKALVDPIKSNTFLVSFEDGTVQAWRRKSDVALWSLSSGPPLTSFHSFSKKLDGEEEDEEYWNVDGPRVSVEDDGFISIHNVLNRTKTLKITLDDLRKGLVHVRSGEIIQVDRQTKVFLVDLDTGAITQELWNGNTEDLNLDEEKKSLFLIRTDYTAKASNLSGSSLWSFSYGEIGTLMTGLEASNQNLASLALIPKLQVSASGVPYKIAPPLLHPAAIVGQSGVDTKSLPSPQNRGHEHLALTGGPAPASLPLPKPPLSMWEQHDSSIMPYVDPAGMLGVHAPGMLAPPKPASKIQAVYTTAAGIVIIAICGVIFKISTSVRPSKVPPLTPLKKKKARKPSPNGKESSPTGQESDGSTKESRTKLQLKYGSGTQVGRLFVTNVLIGRGSNGTLVLEGYLDERNVAVKRLLAQYYDKAQKEIALLIASDEHPNVVRYYATEETEDFVYVSLERCSFSLYDLILAQTFQNAEQQVQECLAGKGLKLRSVEDFNLWDERGRPSPQLFQIMRDIVSGLAHLHAVGIVHRDLKPHNVLISSGRIMQAKIADMGLSKQLDDDAVSFDTQLTGHGSLGSRGWQAPEQLLKGRGSRAVDIFSLGCVLYHCITGGKHPFGSHLERDGNIACGKMDLFHVVDFPEATDLIESLLDPDPAKRPSAQDILLHPFFWDAEKRMCFLKDASDRVELDIKDPNSVLYADLESLETFVLCGGWDAKLDFPLLQNIRGYRRYNFKSVRDLLRVIRNKANHYRELPEQLQTTLGCVPDGIDDYFSSRFPRLLIEVYHVIGYHCRGDISFEKYYPASYLPKFPPQEPK